MALNSYITEDGFEMGRAEKIRVMDYQKYKDMQYDILVEYLTKVSGYEKNI